MKCPGVRPPINGRAHRRPSETAECLTFIDWTKLVTFKGAPLYERVVKIPNERGKRSPMIAILTAMGMRNGFPDYAIFAPAGQWYGLCIEAKRIGEKAEQDQRAWIDRLHAWGYYADCGAGALEMIAIARLYMKISGATDAGLFIDRTRLDG